MIHLYLGFKTFSRMEVPDVLHIGDNVDAGRKTVADKLAVKGSPYVRVGLQRGLPGVVPVPIPETDGAIAARQAKEAAEKLNREQSELKAKAEKASEIIAKAKKEAAEAEAALKALAADPGNEELKKKANKEKAEAEAAAKKAAKLKT